MAKLQDKVENALNESRTLVLGVEVLLGFSFRGPLESGYEKLPIVARYLGLGSLALLSITLGLLLAPAAYHRIVAHGQDTHDLHRFSTNVMNFALFPFAASIGANLFVVGSKSWGVAAGGIAGVVGGGIALLFWYGLEAHDRGKRKKEIEEFKVMQRNDREAQSEETPLSTKIKHVLTEARMVLPGAQALLGFAFIAFLMDGFDKLPEASKTIHLISLCLIAVSTILLMAPAAYHRIVEEGEDTENFHRLASRMILAAMMFLALGVSSDFYVVMVKIADSPALAALSSLLLLCFFLGLWFGYTAYRRGKDARIAPTGVPSGRPTTK